MKKTIFLILIGVGLLSANVYAQDTEPGFKVGLKGGVQLSNLYVDNVDDENSKFGFQAGLYFRNQITENFALQPELIYSLKGSEINYDALSIPGLLEGGSGSYRFNLGYVEIPVLAVVTVGALSIHAGPYVALLTNANIKNVDDDGDIEDIASLDRDDFNTLDYGIAGGIGLNLPSGILGLRYTYGLNEIGKSDIAGKVTENSKNAVLSLYAGFHF